jgi:FHA domain
MSSGPMGFLLVFLAIVIVLGAWLVRRNWLSARSSLWRAWATGRFPRVIDKLIGRAFEQSDTLAGLQEQIMVLVLRQGHRTRGGRVLLPTSVVVGCHPQDFRTLTDGTPDIQKELNQELRAYTPEALEVTLELRELLSAAQGIVRVISTDFSAKTLDLSAKQEAVTPTRAMRPTASLRLGSRAVPLMADQYTVGRAGDNDLHLISQLISKYHAQLYIRNGEWYVKDLDSRNGTRVNGTRIAGPLCLEGGDVILFADVEATFQEQDSPR